jgi:osmotically-inducible protein OsmY
MKTNEELQRDVMAEIKWDPMLRNVAPRIGVTASDGVITLSGSVDSYSEILAAEQAAQRVSGVKVVAEDIEVSKLGMEMRSDTDIARAVKNALTWHSLVNEDLVEIKVENGWVYLDGEAEWDYQKKAAENAVENLTGVVGVINRIKIKNTINVKDVKSNITKAFHRSATIDSGHVVIEVYGNTVTLRGKVRSFAEKKEAEKATWSAPGVTAVVNNLEVDSELLELA